MLLVQCDQNTRYAVASVPSVRRDVRERTGGESSKAAEARFPLMSLRQVSTGGCV